MRRLILLALLCVAGLMAGCQDASLPVGRQCRVVLRPDGGASMTVEGRLIEVGPRWVVLGDVKPNNRVWIARSRVQSIDAAEPENK